MVAFTINAIISSTMVSRQLLGYLFLGVMLRYGNAYKSNANYLDAILMTLERIETGMLKLVEQSASGCAHFSHTEKLAERSKVLDDDEVHSGRGWNPHEHSTNFINVRRSISNSDENDDYRSLLRKPKRNRSSNRNQNVNSNANINTNTNINANRAKIFDLSDETSAV
ncbi:uncharacterized protein LOC116843762 [Odontomachus brunneus]|uniref:uncharacterized protein LOC116843762 n=1 Tax=Odontomachus brunneus TaxID=486640 RepID=UPI0013F295EF|nr:uncharacterized protein LOC116843762 [Odontomachus brunneus]